MGKADWDEVSRNLFVFLVGFQPEFLQALLCLAPFGADSFGSSLEPTPSLPRYGARLPGLYLQEEIGELCHLGALVLFCKSSFQTHLRHLRLALFLSPTKQPSPITSVLSVSALRFCLLVSASIFITNPHSLAFEVLSPLGPYGLVTL